MPETIESIQAKMANTTDVQARILQIIQRRPGERNAITDVEICEALGRSKGYERAVRDAIRTMRKSGIPICSASGVGYHWPEDFGDIGTTGVACMQTGRNFIGCEISPEYFAIAERRIGEAKMQGRLF